MTAWTIKSNVDKTYDNVVDFFNQKVSNLEAYKATSGNTNSIKSVNAAVEIVDILNTHKAANEAAAAAIHQHNKEHAMAMKDPHNVMSSQANNKTK